MFKVGDKFLCVSSDYLTFTEGREYVVISKSGDHRAVFTNDRGFAIPMWVGSTFSGFQLVRSVPEPTSHANDPATSKGKRKVNKYEEAVLDILKGLYEGQGYTGKQIAGLTGHPLNCITPRFAPLRRKGKIKAALQPDGYPVKRDKQIVWVLA